jgi:hypothetical protein
MPLYRRDANELSYNAIFLLSKIGNPNYWNQFFKNVRQFFYGFHRQDLIETLDLIIYEKIERVMGIKINMFLIVYKNLPAHNSFTHSKNPVYKEMPIYKSTMEEWLDEIERWAIEQVMMLSVQIRWTTPARQYI